MLTAENLALLVAIASGEDDADRALDQLTEQALRLTASRNAMIARINEELGTLELRHGSGRDWTLKAYSEHIRVGDAQGEGIVAYVAAKGASFISGDVQNEPRYRNLFGSASEIAVPIRDLTGRIRAVLNVESDIGNHYGPEDLRLCETIADLAAIVLDRERRADREEALVQIGSFIDRAKTEEELIQRVLDVAGELLRFQSCSIFLYDKESGQYVLRGSAGSLKQRVGGVAYRAGEGCTGWVCEHQTPLMLDHPQRDHRWKGIHLEVPSEKIASYLAVPIVSRGRSVGALRVLRRASDNPHLDNSFTQDDQRLLQTIADQLSAGLEGLRHLQKTVQVERMAAWGELSAKSSHMIGNRVFALRGDVNELGHLLEEKPLSRERLAAIHLSLGTNVTRVEEILQDFRDFVTATQASLVQADLNFLVREASLEVFPRRGAYKLEFDLAEGLPIAQVDARKLRRAVSELVENALNYFTDGTLLVKTRLAPPTLVARARLPAGRYAAIEVQDPGPGVKLEDKDRIFQPFYSSRVKGMGLGLSIVKGIAEAHGGTVVEVGREGRGARFVILLPVERRRPARKSVSKKQEP